MLTGYKHLSYGLTLLIAAIVLVLISLPALHGPLVLDSNKLYSITDIVAEHGKLSFLYTPEFGVGFDRLVSMFSFVLNIQFSESLSATQLKATNIGIHITCSVLAFLFIRCLLEQTSYKEKAPLLALITSLLWLLSPINFNTSIYVIQRMTQLSTLFILLGLYLYSKGRLATQNTHQWLYIGGSIFICLPLAVLSKENGILLVAFFFLIEIYFLSITSPILPRRQLAWIASIGAIASILALIYLFPGTMSYEHREFSLSERLLSQARALISYIQEIVFPYSSDIGVFTDDFKVSKSLFGPITTAFSLLLLTGIVIFCIRSNRAKMKLPAFGFAFFLVGHSIESGFIPLELYFPHRNYLPSLGIYLALAWAAAYLLPNRKWRLTIVMVALTYFSAISYARSQTWSSRENIIITSAYYHPTSPRALSNYAQLALEQRNFELALAAINKSIALSNTLNRYIQRLYILCSAGADITDNEYRQLQTVKNFGVSNELAQALSNLLALYQSNGCRQLDVSKFVDALQLTSSRYQKDGVLPWTTEYYMVTFLYTSGAKAIAHQRLQYRLKQLHPESGLYRAQLLIDEGRPDEAAKTLEQVRDQLDHTNRDRLGPILLELSRQVLAESGQL